MMRLRFGCLPVALTLACFVPAAADEPSVFRLAKPIWPAGRETEMNLQVGFRAVIPAQPQAVLRVAAATLYRACVNGEFLGHGPARGPHGHYRVDEWDLSGKLTQPQNVIAIEVAGYNCNSYYLLDQPSFLQAEVVAGDQVLAATAGAGSPFTAMILDDRLQKVQRYSFQRPFIEVYRLQPGFDRWQREASATLTAVEVATQPTQPLLPRRVLRPDFAIIPPVRHVAEGRLEPRAAVPQLWKDRSLVNVGPALKGFPEKELAVVTSTELQQLNSVETTLLDRPCGSDDPLELRANTYHVLDLGANLTGFLGATVTCARTRG